MSFCFLHFKFCILNRRRQNAFTLMELMVVVSLVLIILGVGMTNYITQIKRSRDGRRKSDLEQIRAALEMYRADNRSYPTTTTNCLSSPWWGCWQNYLNGALNGYISAMPQDPIFRDTGGACSSGDASTAYHYCTPDGGNTYILSTRLETDSTPSTQTCGCNGFSNYKVTNP